MTPEQHYEIALRRTDKKVSSCSADFCIGDIRHEDHVIALPQGESSALLCNTSNFTYNFSAKTHSADIDLGGAQTKFLSTELAGNFTGVVIGLYAQNMRIKAIKRVFTVSDAKIRKSMIAKDKKQKVRWRIHGPFILLSFSSQPPIYTILTFLLSASQPRCKLT